MKEAPASANTGGILFNILPFIKNIFVYIGTCKIHYLCKLNFYSMDYSPFVMKKAIIFIFLILASTSYVVLGQSSSQLKKDKQKIEKEIANTQSLLKKTENKQYILQGLLISFLQRDPSLSLSAHPSVGLKTEQILLIHLHCRIYIRSFMMTWDATSLIMAISRSGQIRECYY